PEHPFFIATQFHPEFQSRPNTPHPLFKGLIQAACHLLKKDKTTTLGSESKPPAVVNNSADKS
ncbi:CTP synthase, partial [Limnoraphis robusta]|nr:CTP synthase [Limnoraphis robusta]